MVYAVFSLSLAACSISRPITDQHPSVQRLTPSEDDSDVACRATARATAIHELGCASVDMVLTLERQHANTAAARYVFEGCGKRALYAETCEDYPHCRYLLLSIVPAPGATPPQPAVVAPPPLPSLP